MILFCLIFSFFQKDYAEDRLKKQIAAHNLSPIDMFGLGQKLRLESFQF